VIIYDNQLTGADRQEVENYLTDKYIADSQSSIVLWNLIFSVNNAITTTDLLGTFLWDISTLPNTNDAKIRIRSFDGINFSDWSESGLFSISNTVPGGRSSASNVNSFGDDELVSSNLNFNQDAVSETVNDSLEKTITLIVAKDGSGDYSKIQDAINVAVDGTLIIVQPGTYQENINFLGKIITIRSRDPENEDLVGATIIENDSDTAASTVLFVSGETYDTELEGFTIRNGNKSIILLLDDASPLIRNNRIVGTAVIAVESNSAVLTLENNTINGDFIAVKAVRSTVLLTSNIVKNTQGIRFIDSTGSLISNYYMYNTGAISCGQSSLTLSNNIISYNTGFSENVLSLTGNTGINSVNNVIVYNAGNGILSVDSGTGSNVLFNRMSVTNSILWGNTAGDQDVQMSILGTIDVNYSIVENGFSGINGSVIWGVGNVDSDPFFGDPESGDFHLKSKDGRWSIMLNKWVIDSVNSPAINLGDPANGFSNEPDPNGGRINVGAFGNTNEASKGDR